MPEFKKISDIDITSENSWWDNVFLTLDIDWAHDDVLMILEATGEGGQDVIQFLRSINYKNFRKEV